MTGRLGLLGSDPVVWPGQGGSDDDDVEYLQSCIPNEDTALCSRPIRPITMPAAPRLKMLILAFIATLQPSVYGYCVETCAVGLFVHASHDASSTTAQDADSGLHSNSATVRLRLLR